MTKKKIAAILMTLLGTMSVSGCNYLAFFGYLIAPEIPEKKVPAEFDGLAKHSVVVVIYADAKTQFDFPLVRWELASMISSELSKNVEKVRVVDPRAVLRYQDENLEWDAMDKTALGKLFGADYVLYVAINTFSTIEAGSEYLFRGELNADIALHQVSLSERQSRVWNSSDVHINYPDQAVAAENDALVRPATEALFADFVAKKFYKHSPPKKE